MHTVGGSLGIARASAALNAPHPRLGRAARGRGAVRQIGTGVGAGRRRSCRGRRRSRRPTSPRCFRRGDLARDPHERTEPDGGGLVAEPRRRDRRWSACRAPAAGRRMRNWASIRGAPCSCPNAPSRRGSANPFEGHDGPARRLVADRAPQGSVELVEVAGVGEEQRVVDDVGQRRADVARRPLQLVEAPLHLGADLAAGPDPARRAGCLRKAALAVGREDRRERVRPGEDQLAELAVGASSPAVRRLALDEAARPRRGRSARPVTATTAPAGT